MPMHIARCPCCEAEERVPVPTDEPARVLDLAEVGLFSCNRCGARVVHGVVMPRVVVEPFRDARGFVWVRYRFQDPKTKADVHVVDLDPKFAAQVSTNALSLAVL